MYGNSKRVLLNHNPQPILINTTASYCHQTCSSSSPSLLRTQHQLCPLSQLKTTQPPPRPSIATQTVPTTHQSQPLVQTRTVTRKHLVRSLPIYLILTTMYTARDSSLQIVLFKASAKKCMYPCQHNKKTTFPLL